MNPLISIYDTFIILFYFLVVLGLGLYLRSRDHSTTDYFLAGRNLSWFVVGISLFATNISSEHFIGLAGSGASRGLAVGQFELIAIFLLTILGWFLAPIFKNLGIFTTPEFLEKRFDSSSRKFFSGLSIFTYIVTKILVTLIAGGILFGRLLDLNIFSSAVIIVLITGVYTLIGGFSAVVRTQVFQGILFLSGAIVLTILGLNEVGGFSGLTERLPAEHFQMFKSIDDPAFPWTGIIFGAPIIAFWYWCTDYYIVQRILGAKSINDARSGTLFASFLKIFPVFVLVLPGLIAAALFPEITGDEAYPALIAGTFIPAGVRGFIITGFLAAMMSSLSASFNSIAALYTMDFYKPKHPDASERTLVLVGRMATIVVVVIAILLVPFVKIVDNQIYIFLQSMQAFIGAPVAAVFLFGLLIKKTNAKSAFYTLIIGELVGLSRFTIEFLSKSGVISDQFLISFAGINYLHFTIFLFLGSILLMMILNYLLHVDKTEGEREINFLSVEKISGSKNGTGIANSRINIVLSGVVLVLTLSLWYLFI